ncbi:Ornithine aminotransferase 2 [Rubripirellula obstinata]|uniref:Ornithine aminotransferase 2 n=1 Tax=Rubripirellula obstinata TaxID=406547 RepID=A0A5B1CEM7_9BACT|nr:aminotransferase class III-fold pyridoxal phosphate-dependent enzyme [Rubripirellula obstinata]KAA1259607.1 Ornithine aminotransferase 2 [Rubripirellula obstinata]
MNDEEPGEESIDDGLELEDHSVAEESSAEEPADAPEPGFILPPSTAKPFSGPPTGITRGDDANRDLIDAMAGRYSVFGFGESKLIESAMQAVDDLALVNQSSTATSVTELIQRISDSSSDTSPTLATAFAHRDLAIEAAITFSRTRDQGKRYRTIAISGSDHGRTGVCRTASGLPALRENYGPMMAGFAHVRPGDLDAIKANIDDQTGCVLISPLQLDAGARPIDAEFLIGVRELCDQHGLLLAVDESEVVFGSCGTMLASASIADVAIDLAIVSAGLFAGMPGGLLLSSLPIQVDQGDDNPIATAVATATIDEMIHQDLFASAAETSHQFAVDIAEAIAGYDFVRDIAQLGTVIGIETDIESNLLVKNASHFGLHLVEAGETAVRMALPITVSKEDFSELTRRLAETFEATEKLTAAVHV